LRLFSREGLRAPIFLGDYTQKENLFNKERVELFYPIGRYNISWGWDTGGIMWGVIPTKTPFEKEGVDPKFGRYSIQT